MRDQYGRQVFPGHGFAAVPGPSTGAPPEQEIEPGMIPPGEIVRYYNDLASGLVVPEDMRLEDLQFRVQIDPLGNIIVNTEAIQLISRYQLAFNKMVAWAADPDVAGAAPSLVSFNIHEQGRNFNVFKRPVNLQSLLSRQGSGNIHEWRGVYITVPGTDIEVQWTVDTARWPALVGAAREFGVQLLGDYVACAPGRR
jgi:hypothetical protein